MDIPVLKVQGKTLPEVWERAVVACWEQGVAIRTEYDKPGDPPSRDCTMVMVVEDPFSQPRIHRALPCGLDDLEVYRQEVVVGVHDHWIDLDPESTKWRYTYHQRFTAYGHETGFLPTGPFGKRINQLDYVVETLAETGYTRRALASTWQPWLDPGLDDPPCVQYSWFRILNNRLVMNTHIRSNDAYKAAFMNIFVFSELQRFIATVVDIMVKDKTGKWPEIKPGQFAWIADSFHIYGSYFKEFQEKFLEPLKIRTFEERTWTSEFAEPFFREGRERLARERAAEKI